MFISSSSCAVCLFLWFYLLIWHEIIVASIVIGSWRQSCVVRTPCIVFFGYDRTWQGYHFIILPAYRRSACVPLQRALCQIFVTIDILFYLFWFDFWVVLKLELPPFQQVRVIRSRSLNIYRLDRQTIYYGKITWNSQIREISGKLLQKAHIH